MRQKSIDIANKVLGSNAANNIRHYYHYTLAGFTIGPITPREVVALQNDPGVLLVVPDQAASGRRMVSAPTFLGLDAAGGIWSNLGGQQSAGDDVVVCVVDTGIWPELPSFSDRADAVSNSGSVVYNDPPATYTGYCQPGDNVTTSTCKNREPHGTHVASIAAGNADIPSELFPGHTLSGVAPRARVASYKVEWGDEDSTYFISDFVAGIDAAAADGCDVINFSTGIVASNVDLATFRRPVELSMKNAAAAGVFIVAAGGNTGPDLSTVVDVFGPWMCTAAASTTDRRQVANVTLGNGAGFIGESSAPAYSAVGPARIVLGEDIAVSGAAAADARRCYGGTLDPAKSAGNIVVCDRGGNFRVQKSQEVQQAGGIGMVLINVIPDNLAAEEYYVPSVHLQDEHRKAVRQYIMSAGAAATATLGPSTLLYGSESAPQVIEFSSRGPIVAGDGNLLKPDITAPGVNVVAAWPAFASPSGYREAILSVVAGVGALLAQAHPSWTPAMIRSAIMTTAYQSTKAGPGSGQPFGGPFDFGAGHVDATAANNPANPETFTLAPGASQVVQFNVTKQPDTPLDKWRDGSITWTSSQGTKVRIPVVVRAAELAVSPPEIRLRGPRPGKYTYNVIPSWSGSIVTIPIGFSAAQVVDGIVDANVNGGATSFKITIPPIAAGGWSYVRFRIFAEFVSSPGIDKRPNNLDLSVAQNSKEVGSSAGDAGVSYEEVNLWNATGDYTVTVSGTMLPSGTATFKLHWWLLRMPVSASSNAVSTPNARMPAVAVAGEPVPVSLSFSARITTSSQKFLGAVVYGRGSGNTTPRSSHPPLPTITLVEVN
eukprot:gene11933-12076_t